MAIKQVAHVCLHVMDVERSTDFYSRILGLPVKFRFNKKNGTNFGAYFDAGNGTFIEIFKTDEEKLTEAHMVHMCLEVDSIEATIEDIRSKGHEVTDKKLGCDQSWQAWITDPDGVKIELHEYTANSSQKTGNDLTVDW